MEAYAGIGARKTPEAVKLDMMAFARHMMQKDWWLRTGAAEGADQAFAIGACHKNTILYLPWANYNLTYQHEANLVKIGCWEPAKEAIEFASRYHPEWDNCSRGTQALHGRNAHIILGKNLDRPVKFVIYWANESTDGEVEGGTGLGVRLARAHHIPCFNLKLMSMREVEREVNLL